ncbi:MAG: hypothetical protein AABW79_01840 [Nanoarchaeota archaeon]
MTRWVAGDHNSVYEALTKSRPDGYFVVGRTMSLEDIAVAGLEGRVEAGESVVFVPKEIIDRLKTS